jgi:hypothetical protein
MRCCNWSWIARWTCILNVRQFATEQKVIT